MEKLNWDDEVIDYVKMLEIYWGEKDIQSNAELEKFNPNTIEMNYIGDYVNPFISRYNDGLIKFPKTYKEYKEAFNYNSGSKYSVDFFKELEIEVDKFWYLLLFLYDYIEVRSKKIARVLDDSYAQFSEVINKLAFLDIINKINCLSLEHRQLLYNELTNRNIEELEDRRVKYITTLINQMNEDDKSMLLNLMHNSKTPEINYKGFTSFDDSVSFDLKVGNKKIASLETNSLLYLKEALQDYTAKISNRIDSLKTATVIEAANDFSDFFYRDSCVKVSQMDEKQMINWKAYMAILHIRDFFNYCDYIYLRGIYENKVKMKKGCNIDVIASIILELFCYYPECEVDRVRNLVKDREVNKKKIIFTNSYR